MKTKLITVIGVVCAFVLAASVERYARMTAPLKTEELLLETSSQVALFTTRRDPTSNGQNIWLGNGGQSTSATLATDGARNTSLGWDALLSATDGTANTCVGHNACMAVTTASTNVAVGANALVALTTANAGDGGNVAVGYGAMAGCTTGFYNVAIGADAIGLGTCTSSAHGNIAMGHSTLKLLTDGFGNLCIGDVACANVTTSENNVAIGTSALVSATTGLGLNVAIGKGALGNLTTGVANTVVGSLSASGVITASANTVMGYNTVTNMTGQENNVFGYNNSGLTSGSQNTIIGAGLALSNTNNMVILADGAGGVQFQCRGVAAGSTAVDFGTVQAGSNNCFGTVTGVGAHTQVQLQFTAAYAARSRCFIQGIGAAQVYTVTQSASVPVISCFDMAGVAANCEDFSYHCVGQ